VVPRLVPALGALWGATVCLAAQLAYGKALPDARIFWTAGRAVLTGADPYTAVRALETGYPFFYPFPAALAWAPLALLPWSVAWVAWSALGGALLAHASRWAPGLLGALLSAGFLNAVAEGQWSPLLTASAVLPWLAPVAYALKPSLGAVLWVRNPALAPIVGGIVALALSWLLEPGWLAGWLAALQQSNHVAPVFRPGGVVLLLAGLRWRTPEGRLLLGLALVPHTVALYETLPLFLLARSRMEGYLLAGLTVTAAGVAEVVMTGASIEARATELWPLLLVLVYLPALALVLRPVR
jgi:hypothetical protein